MSDLMTPPPHRLVTVRIRQHGMVPWRELPRRQGLFGG